MQMKKKVRSALSVCLCGAVMMSSVLFTPLATNVSAVSQSEINALQQQKNTLASNKKAQKQAMEKLQQQQASYIEQKTALDQEQQTAVEEINLTKEQLELYRQMILEKQEEADQAQADADDQLVLYKEHLRSMEEQGMFNFYLSILFGAGDFSDLLSRIDMISEIMEYDKKIEDGYKEARDHALETKAEYEETEQELSVKEDELQAEIDQLQKEMQEAQDQINALQNDINTYKAAYDKYASDEDAIQSKINQMTDQLKKQQEQQTGTGSVTPSGNYIWPCPSTTVVTSNYGYRYLSLYGYTRLHAGVDIGGSYGATVVAAASGTVSVATYSSSYGNYVMIYHPDGTSTTYAHMSSLAVSAGQTVNQGDVVGYVGSTGNSTGPHLHFEVRVNGGTVDPMQYF